MTGRMTKLQANVLRDNGESTEVFNHCELGYFDITRMRDAIKSYRAPRDGSPYPTKRVRFDDQRASHDQSMNGEKLLEWLVGQREVDEERVRSLTPEELDDPVIVLFDDEMHAYVIDGIHRIVGRFRRGDVDYEFYPIPMSIAKDFNIPRHLAEMFDIPWGEKDVIGSKLVNIRTGERT